MFVLCTVICDNAVGLAFTLFTYRFPLAASQLATATKLIRRYCIGNVISCAVLPSIFDRPHWRLHSQSSPIYWHIIITTETAPSEILVREAIKTCRICIALACCLKKYDESSREVNWIGYFRIVG